MLMKEEKSNNLNIMLDFIVLSNSLITLDKMRTVVQRSEKS